MRSFNVTWHRGWNSDLDNALNALPEMEMCPRELYRHLLTLPASPGGRTALVTDSDGPVALIGLRRARRGGSFEPVTNWLVPGQNFPVREGKTLEVLDALNVRLGYAWWRTPGRPVESASRGVEHTATYGMKSGADFEAFWRESGMLKTVRQARKRCAKYRVEVNPPGGAAWVIRNWDRQWRGEGYSPSLPYRLAIAEHLERLGRHWSLALFDGDKMIAGATQIIHAGAAVAGVLYYLPEYRKDGIGNRLIDLHFEHGRAAGLEIDLGGGHDYKARWAPVLGERSVVTVWPPLLRPLRAAARFVRDRKAKGIPRPFPRTAL